MAGSTAKPEPPRAPDRSESGQAASDRPMPARMYNYLLDGKDNLEIDRAAIDALYALTGDLPKQVAWENRRFLWRCVEYLAGECGIDQFIDVGAGLPAVRSTHEIAREMNPGARVVYADYDPFVVSHGRALLADDGNTTVISADARDPESVLDAPQTSVLIDFGQPVAVMFVALFHFITSPGHPRHEPGRLTPGEIVAAFRERAAPGSYLVLSHLTTHDAPVEPVRTAEKAYENAASPLVSRPRAEIAAMFDGWDLVSPGLVRPWQWRSGPDEAPATPYLLGGIARKRA